MIIDNFDNKSKAFISPEDLYQKGEKNELVTIVTFKRKILNYVINKYHAKLFTSFSTTNESQDVYEFVDNNKRFLIYMTGITSPLAVLTLEEVITITGSHKFIFFGSCGVLDEEKCRGKFIVPNVAIRDEGTSYHYYEPSEEIIIRNHHFVEEILKENNIPYVSGKVWTTDAIYMETINNINKHKSNGAIAVEMETSAIEALARFRNVDNYHLLFSGDSLDNAKWDRADLGGDKELALQISSFNIALHLAHKIS